MSKSAVLEVPANYFGKGEDYMLPDDPEVIREFERKFQEYEAAHPEDPTGELALARAKKNHEPTSKLPTEKKEDSEKVEDESEWAELELTLPPSHIKLLKNYARFRRRRPRDIVIAWIEQFCRI